MEETGLWYFGPFHLDVGAERLWHGTEEVRLTAKAWGVLHYLVVLGRSIHTDSGMVS